MGRISNEVIAIRLYIIILHVFISLRGQTDPIFTSFASKRILKVFRNHTT